MTYRDDGDARAARVEALDHELAAARRRIAELEGGAKAVRVVRITRTPDGKGPIVYTFDRGMFYERRCEVARGFSDRLRVQGAVELAPPLIIWRGGGTRLELQGSTDTTTLTCRDARPGASARSIWLLCWLAAGMCRGAWDDSTIPMFWLVAIIVLVVLGAIAGVVGFLRGHLATSSSPDICERAAAYIEEACLASPPPRRR